MKIIKSNSDVQFELVIQEQEQSIIAEFGSQWCTNCHGMLIRISKMIESFNKNPIILETDISLHPITIQKYNIKSIPTVLFFRSGAPVARWSTILSIESLEKLIEEVA